MGAPVGWSVAVGAMKLQLQLQLQLLQSVQLIMGKLLLERPGVSHMTLPPQGIGGSDRFGSWVGFWALNTGF